MADRMSDEELRKMARNTYTLALRNYSVESGVVEITKALRQVRDQTEQRIEYGRCLITRNVCGTDTRPIGHPCACGPCQEYLRVQRETEQRVRRETMEWAIAQLFPCHFRPKREWCDWDGLGGFMGHTCANEVFSDQFTAARGLLRRAAESEPKETGKCICVGQMKEPDCPVHGRW